MRRRSPPYRVEGPEIWDWVSGRYEPPRNPDGRSLETVAKSVARQFASKARVVAKAAKAAKAEKL